MKIISIGTMKGGTGKTSTAFSIAGVLAERGHKVLLLDADPQGNLTNNLAVNKLEEGFKGTESIFTGGATAAELIRKSPIKELPTLDIIPSSMKLGTVDMQVVNLAGRERILMKWMKENFDALDDFQYLICDSNPSMSIVNQNIFLASDSIILVTEPGMNSFEGLVYFKKAWGDILNALDLPNNIDAVILNKYRKGVNMHEDFVDFLKGNEDFGKLLLEPYVGLATKVNETEVASLPINLYERNGKAHQSFEAIVDKLIKQGVL